MSFTQQRSKMSRAELRAEIEDRLCNMIPGDTKSGPDISILRKAGTALDEIMALVDKYVA